MTPSEILREYLSGFPQSAPCHAALAEQQARIEDLTIALRDLVSHGNHLNAEQRASLDRARDVLAGE